MLRCSVRPVRSARDTSGPSAQTPAALKEMAGNDQWKMATPSDALLKGNWWEIFGDPQLNRLEELVNINNQNVKQAEAQFRQARALVAANHANYYPSIGSTPSITQSDTGSNARQRRNQPDFFLAGNRDLGAGSVGPGSFVGRECGEQRAGERGRSREYPAQRSRRCSPRITFRWRREDMQQSVLQDTIDAYEKNLQLTHDRYNGGVASKSDITLAQTQLAGAKAQSTETRDHASAVRARHRRADRPARHPRSISAPARSPRPPPPIPVAVPSQLLERRPDIAANERQVAAANANVGIAETAYYPTLTLSASAGLLSTIWRICSPMRAAAGPRARRLPDAVRFRPPRSRSWQSARPPTTPRSPLTGRPCSPPSRKSRMILQTCAILRKRQCSSRKPL